ELIARIPLDEYRVFAQFRIERFLLPVTLITPTSSSLAQQVDHVFSDLRNHDITTAYYLLSENKSKTVADVVEEAAQGIIIEGTALDKTHEAEWLAQQLRNVKHFGASIDFIEEVYILPDIPSEIRRSTYACIIYSTQLPKEALNLCLFNSQSCESIFRNTRALSGAYSTTVNFTVYDFLRRAQKLTILNDIKSKELVETEKQLKFPVHHKHKHDNQFLSLQNLSDVESLDVEQTIRNSYEFAVKLIELLNISKVLKKYNVFKLDELGEFIGHHLRTKSKLADNSKMDNDNSSKIDSEFDLGDDNEDNKDEPSRTKNTRAGC
ncbi:unnamed protein product, partial [Didymodactylos carnosus]